MSLSLSVSVCFSLSLCLYLSRSRSAHASALRDRKAFVRLNSSLIYLFKRIFCHSGESARNISNEIIFRLNGFSQPFLFLIYYFPVSDRICPAPLCSTVYGSSRETKLLSLLSFWRCFPIFCAVSLSSAMFPYLLLANFQLCTSSDYQSFTVCVCETVTMFVSLSLFFPLSLPPPLPLFLPPPLSY